MKTVILRIFITLVMLLSVPACAVAFFRDPTLTPTTTPTATPTTMPTATNTSTPTPVPPTATPTVTPTPTWIWQAAGDVTCPILLYHHVSNTPPSSAYYISIAGFEAEMNLLHDWGYTTISISHLVQAITQGAEMPTRPIVVSFDDGNEDVYTNAFPIMQRLGFQGVLYIVSDRLGAKGYLGVPEIMEMDAAGWEVGNHSLDHLNLVDNPASLWDEAARSRKDLQESLGLPVNTFAYPFGVANDSTMRKIASYGYTAAVGLGTSPIQGPFNLFYLNRIVLDYSNSMDQFTSLLPWQGPINHP
jgi:peptidoglycan/xylan/chitin deacetylase (PgdA/CDA1 family)